MLLSIQKVAVAQMGQTVEVGSVRIHRFRESVKITDLTNAGLRGKKVEEMVVSIRGYSNTEEQLEEVMWAIEGAKSFDRIFTILTKDFPELQPETDLNITRTTLRGVDVVPGGFSPVVVVGDKVQVEVGYKTFVVKDLEDQDNMPTCIPSAKGGIKEIPLFYRWVRDNEAKIKKMSFSEIQCQMDILGVRSHFYCAMD